MVTISQKAFNEDMDKYLNNIRKKSSDSKSTYGFFKKFVDEEVPEMDGNDVHVEYKEPSFFKKLFRWKRKQKIDELEDELSEDEIEKLQNMEEEIEAIEDEESELNELEEELEERR